MKAFFADWRNPTLVVGALIILLLIGLLITSSGNQPDVASVGTRKITYADALSAMKRGGGNAAVMRLIGNMVVEDYARQQKVTASEAEIDQIMKMMRLQAEMQNTTLEALLKQDGTTLAERKREVAIEILRAKLIVPEADVKAAYAKFAKDPRPPMTVPAYFRFTRLIFTDKADAEKAVGILAKGPASEKELDGLKTLLGGHDSQKPLLYIPTEMKEPLPGFNKILAGLKPGGVTKPLQVAGQLWAVIKLDSSVPEDKPTYETRNALVAIQLVRDEKYRMALTDLESKALEKVDVQVYNSDFREIDEQLSEIKKQNFNIQGAPQQNVVPGASNLPGMNGTPRPGAAPAPSARPPKPPTE